MINLYYVESAPQLMSAWQAANCFQEKSIYWIRKNGSLHNDNQIDAVLDMLSLTQKDEVWIGTPFSIRVVRRLLSIRCRFGAIRLFVGDCRSKYAQVLGALFIGSEKVLLDDGIASIMYFRQYIENRNSSSLFTRWFWRPDWIRLTLSGLILYTALPISAGQQVKSHRFQALVNGQSKFEREDDVAIFIGSKVVEVGLISLENFHLAISKFIKRNPGKHLVYVPHRAELLSKLKGYEGELEIRELALPIELEVIRSRVFPSVIEGFYTGAFVFFKYLSDSITIRNHRISKSAENSKYHGEITECDHLMDALLNDRCRYEG